MNKTFLLLTFSLLFKSIFSSSFILAQEEGAIEWKDWSEYTEVEKRDLRDRWTPEKVRQVVQALKETKEMPDFVKVIPLSYDDRIFIDLIDLFFEIDKSKVKNYDLRGIDLKEQNLEKVALVLSHLEGADLEKANLQEARLLGANLQEADLRTANLQGAVLYDANLQGAILFDANLQGADLQAADLQEALVGSANLQGTRLWKANFQEAYLVFANLQDADLLETNLSSSSLGLVNLRNAKNVEQISWQHEDMFSINERAIEKLALGIPYEIRKELTRIRYKNFLRKDEFLTMLYERIGKVQTEKYKSLILKVSSVEPYVIGEERDGKFEDAKIIYRDLESVYKQELLHEIADEFNFRENEVITKSSPWYLRAFRTVFLKWTYGYGSRPLRLIPYCLGVIVLFAFIYVIQTIPPAKSGIYVAHDSKENQGNRNDERLLPIERGKIILNCIYFSFLSFSTFGYGALQPRQWLEFFRLEPVQYKANRWARVFVGLEAAIGIYLLALLAIVLFGR